MTIANKRQTEPKKITITRGLRSHQQQRKQGPSEQGATIKTNRGENCMLMLLQLYKNHHTPSPRKTYHYEHANWVLSPLSCVVFPTTANARTKFFSNNCRRAEKFN